jgi:hypothetical protein
MRINPFSAAFFGHRAASTWRDPTLTAGDEPAAETVRAIGRSALGLVRSPRRPGRPLERE